MHRSIINPIHSVNNFKWYLNILDNLIINTEIKVKNISAPVA